MEDFLIKDDSNNIKNYNEKLNSSFENDNNDINSNTSTNINIINGMDISKSNNNKKSNISNGSCDTKLENIYPNFNKTKFSPQLDKNVELEYNDTKEYIIPKKKDSCPLTDSNLFSKLNKDSQMLIKNYSLNTYINNTFHSNIDNSIVTNNNNVLLIDNNKSTHADRLDPKNAIKINRIKDTYIDFLQKQNEDHNKLNFNLDSNNKKLLNRCSSLIKDNISLNKILNEKSNRLNKIVQENINIKEQLDKIIFNNNKSEQKLKYYEEQLEYYKINNDNYKKIVDELKEQNQKLNINLNQINNRNEQEIKEVEEKYENKIENIKNDMNKEISELKKKNEEKINELNEEIKNLKFQNKELTKELESKDGVIKIMYKDNQNLINQNKLNIIKLEHNSKQIQDLNKILQTKETMINSLKTKDTESDKLFLSKSNSCSYMKLEGSDFLSENITKLLNDNEENKIKLDYLNSKIKNMNPIEKKSDEILDKNSSFGSRVSYKIRSVGNSREKKYDNQSYYESKNTKKNALKKYGIQNNNEIYFIKNKIDLDSSINSKNSYNKSNNNKMIYFSSNSSFKDNNSETKNDNYFRKNSYEIKNIKNFNYINNTEYQFDTYKKEKNIKKDLDEKSKNNDIKGDGLKIIEIGKIKKPSEYEISNLKYKGRNLFKNQYKKKNLENQVKNVDKSVSIPYISVLKDEEKDENKKMKNYTYMNKKNINYFKRKSSDQIIIIEQENQDKEKEKEKNYEEKKNDTNSNIYYYLYGIDRNNLLHIFDLSNKRWITSKKIFELNLDQNAESFRNDYRYEGTIIYNILSGVYILTGEKTDILYYYNSYTETVSKICKFNYGHNNGSIRYDEQNKYLYILGGKNTTYCEYYSLEDKKIYKLPNLLKDRANGSFIISEGKLFGFFGFCYSEDTYVNSIEFLDLEKMDKWEELSNINYLKENIIFNIESVATMYYKNNKTKILIYCGIEGEDEEFITEYYLVYDVINNSMDKINKWEVNQYKNMGKTWKNYNLNENDPKGFHFAKNSSFILLDENYNLSGYDKKDKIDIMIDYKNNIHVILQDKEKIDIYRSEL